MSHAPFFTSALELLKPSVWPGGLHFDEMRGRGRVVADQRIFGGGAHQPRQVVGRRHVARRQAGRVLVVRARHAERGRLGVHRRDERRRAAGVVARERRRRAILRRHQRQPQHFVARQRRAHAQPRVAALQVVEVVHVDGQRLVERLARRRARPWPSSAWSATRWASLRLPLSRRSTLAVGGVEHERRWPTRDAAWPGRATAARRRAGGRGEEHSKNNG